PDGTPSVLLQDRLLRGLAAWQRGEAGLVMVSGGLGVEGHEEADVMAAWLIARGVPAERVVVDRDGWTTWHTAVNTRALLEARGLSSALVVTSEGRAYFDLTAADLAA
ncbi:MAG: YdcF family protein, partial [Planctomycetota bacterium]|nr:YdcF family protein [Planctomycetota bacterium]